MHQLGKLLIELSGVMTGAHGDRPLTLGEVAVLEDAVAHPGASIREIHQRSGFAQSHVSASVVRLKERGLLTTLGDPPAGSRASAWRAHTHVQATDNAMKAISRRQARQVNEVDLRGAVGLSEAKRAIRLLEDLAEILL